MAAASGDGRRSIHTAAAARLRVRLLGIDPAEARFARRGFRMTDARARERLESVGQAFLGGYRLALREGDGAALASAAGGVPPALRGFAFEGAAMALSLLDALTPWRRGRWQAFVEGPAQPHIYMTYVGVGWTVARLPWLRRRLSAFLARFDPLLGWLVVDGYGFHEGYFDWPRSVRARVQPRGLAGYARRAFDQGLGRSLWFVECADAQAVAAAVAAFPASRQSDLWSGVGLACSYAGGGRADTIEALWALAGPHRAALAQGAAFAAKARARAATPSRDTELACRLLCRRSATDAAASTDIALKGLPATGPIPRYEHWRARVQALLAAEQVPS